MIPNAPADNVGSEDLIHKAAGWLLREAGTTDMLRLETFLRQHGGDMSRTTVRYAIERFPERTRQRLLTQISNR